MYKNMFVKILIFYLVSIGYVHGSDGYETAPVAVKEASGYQSMPSPPAAQPTIKQVVNIPVANAPVENYNNNGNEGVQQEGGETNLEAPTITLPACFSTKSNETAFHDDKRSKNLRNVVRLDDPGTYTCCSWRLYEEMMNYIEKYYDSGKRRCNINRISTGLQYHLSKTFKRTFEAFVSLDYFESKSYYSGDMKCKFVHNDKVYMAFETPYESEEEMTKQFEKDIVVIQNYDKLNVGEIFTELDKALISKQRNVSESGDHSKNLSGVSL
uniref:Ground-like domain-containing protein n=1 Tax=Parastrongyloides trichosuri TaxID=131310 RepID=A0A0N4ZXL3_PARTI